MDSDFRPRPRPLRNVVRAQQLPEVTRKLQSISFGQRQLVQPAQSSSENWHHTAGPKVSQPKKQADKRTLKRALASITVALVVILAAYMLRVVVLQQSSPAHIATMFVQDLERGDSAAALKLSASQYRLPQTATSISGSTIVSSQQNSRAEQASSRQGIVAYTVSTKSGTQYMRVELIRSNNKTWLVSNVIISTQPQNTVEVT